MVCCIPKKGQSAASLQRSMALHKQNATARGRKAAQAAAKASHAKRLAKERTNRLKAAEAKAAAIRKAASPAAKKARAAAEARRLKALRTPTVQTEMTPTHPATSGKKAPCPCKKGA